MGSAWAHNDPQHRVIVLYTLVHDVRRVTLTERKKKKYLVRCVMLLENRLDMGASWWLGLERRDGKQSCQWVMLGEGREHWLMASVTIAKR